MRESHNRTHEEVMRTMRRFELFLPQLCLSLFQTGRSPLAVFFAVYITLCVTGFSVEQALGRGGTEVDIPSWKACLRQDPGWYTSDQAIRIADNVLLYQRKSGGWPKNTDMADVLSKEEEKKIIADKDEDDSTIDNGATYRQLEYLARVYSSTQIDRFLESFQRGLDYLFEAQYENGGWPQFYPNASGYHKHITFNDNAMIGVMRLLRDVAREEQPYAFVSETHRNQAAEAVKKGIECILKCQIGVDGKRTAWCAQHDEKTLEPAPARTYEKVSLSGAESVGIVEFLMGIDQPDSTTIHAIQSAVQWFDRVKIIGIKVVEKRDSTLPRGYDKIVVQESGAGPIWARFYEIGTNRPIFCGRDGIVKYKLSDIEHERRVGYAWYTDNPEDLLEDEYPEWQAKWAPNDNVLKH